MARARGTNMERHFPDSEMLDDRETPDLADAEADREDRIEAEFARLG